jgi:hypothetical protein
MVSVAYIAGFALIAIAGLLAAYLSHRRSAEKEAAFTTLQLEAQRRVAAANKRAADAAAAASEAAASAAVAQEQQRKEILDLTVQLEGEQRLRLEMEERLLRQPPVRVSPETPPRVLKAEQEEEAVRILRAFAGTPVSLIEIEDPEAGPLACQIARIIRNAALQVEVSRFGAMIPAQFGIICTHGPKEPAAAALIRLLRSFNLLVYDRAGMQGQFEILVGLKP